MDPDSLSAIASVLSKGGPAIWLVLVWFGYKAVNAANKAVQAIENMDRTTTVSATQLTVIAQNVAESRDTTNAIADKLGV